MRFTLSAARAGRHNGRMRTAIATAVLLVLIGATWSAPVPGSAAVRADRFSGRAAYESVRRQVALGPRPAGSPASRGLGERLRRALPGGRFEAVPGGLRNVVATVPGRDPSHVVLLGAHYDTKDIPGF